MWILQILNMLIHLKITLPWERLGVNLPQGVCEFQMENPLGFSALWQLCRRMQIVECKEKSHFWKDIIMYMVAHFLTHIFSLQKIRLKNVFCLKAHQSLKSYVKCLCLPSKWHLKLISTRVESYTKPFISDSKFVWIFFFFCSVLFCFVCFTWALFHTS